MTEPSPNIAALTPAQLAALDAMTGAVAPITVRALASEVAQAGSTPAGSTVRAPEADEAPTPVSAATLYQLIRSPGGLAMIMFGGAL